MAAVQEWREVKLNGKGILKQPQPHYDTFKAVFTHGVLGYSRSGRPIWVMKARAIWVTGTVCMKGSCHVDLVLAVVCQACTPSFACRGRNAPISALICPIQ